MEGGGMLTACPQFSKKILAKYEKILFKCFVGKV